MTRRTVAVRIATRRSRGVPLAALGLALASVVAAPALGAQESASRLCLRGAPAPRCRGFVRVEVRGGGPLSEAYRAHYVGPVGPDGEVARNDTIPWADLGDWIGAEVGYGVNVGERWAVGASVALETGNESTRVLARARLRRWLTSRLYAELLPGAFRQERDLFYRSGDAIETNDGLTAEARIGLAGLLFGLARLDALSVPARTIALPSGSAFRHDPGGTVSALSVGGGLEGRAAILTSAVALLVGGVLLLIAGGPIA